jgi:exodeoxyribonuclease VII small subunit
MQEGIFLDCKEFNKLYFQPFIRVFMAKTNFEKDLKKLEDIVARLEEGDVPLNESMKLFEEGVKLSRLCSTRLDKAEKKIEIITADKNGNITAKPFEAGD